MQSVLWPYNAFCKRSLLDKAILTDNLALRCYAEEYGSSASWQRWNKLSPQQQAKFFRLPNAINTGVASGQLVVQLFDKRILVVTETEAERNPFFAYRATDKLDATDVHQRRSAHGSL